MSYLEGGTTPSAGVIRAVKKSVSIPIYVMIRPHGGGFVYSEREIEAMIDDAQLARDRGADGIVVGALRSDGSVDVETVLRVIEAAQLPVTFHRAFDTFNPAQMPHILRQIAELPSVERVLTSGGHANPFEGRHVIADLVRANSLSIMIGGGVVPDFLPQVITETGVKEVHVGVAAREPQTATSPVSVEKVRAIKQLLEGLSAGEAP